MSRYDAYASIPADLVPPTADLSPLGDIIRNFRECVRLRHDIETAASLASGERRLRPPSWESTLANSASPNARTVDRLAAEHLRLATEAQSYVGRLTNPKLRALAQANLTFQFPRIAPGGSCLASGASSRNTSRWGSKRTRHSSSS